MAGHKEKTMYAGFERHKTFEVYKADYFYIRDRNGDKGKSASDFILRECWLAAMPPYKIDGAILANKPICH